MKYIYLTLLLSLSSFSFSQTIEKIETEGVITEITFHQGKKIRETALIKFNLEDGTEQMGSTDLFRIPFIGSMKSVGDKISITYSKDNPFLVETVIGNFLSTYGMYILIFLGIIFSLKPILNYKKSINKEA
jgi:hypothetical protein